MSDARTRRARRSDALWISAFLVPFVVSGCTQSSPSPVSTAAVTWETAPPSGPLEDDPWVRTVRAGDLAWAAAVNSSNFTDPSLLSTWHEDLVNHYAGGAARRLDRGTAYVVLGPQPFAALGVDIDESRNSALVVGCADKVAVSPIADEGTPEPCPQAYQFRLVHGPDGQPRITGVADLQDSYTLPSGDELTDEYCAGVEIAHGSFDPAPDPDRLAQLRGSDLVAPPAQSPSFAVEVPK